MTMNVNNRKRWTDAEDATLKNAIAFAGQGNWKAVSQKCTEIDSLWERSNVQCRQRCEKLAPGRVKGPWQPDEDSTLTWLVRQQLGSGIVAVDFSTIAVSIRGRTSGQCKHRWNSQLCPTLRKGAFTPDEEAKMDMLATTMGNNFARISEQLCGRTSNMVKNYFKKKERTGRATLKRSRPFLPKNTEKQHSKQLKMSNNDFNELITNVVHTVEADKLCELDCDLHNIDQLLDQFDQCRVSRSSFRGSFRDSFRDSFGWLDQIENTQGQHS